MIKSYKIGAKKNSFTRNMKCQCLLTIALGIGLMCFYGYHISSLHATLWELGDEAGYLWNAAYFTGTDWDSIAGIYPYYGYGYSVLLVPLFWITNNGIQLVNGAYIINVICVMGMYLVLIRILKEMSERSDSLSIPIIAFISCMTPYVVSNTLKIFCEVFLSFWYSLLVLLLYLTLKKQKKTSTVLLGVCGAFVFFIHTRAIVIVGMLILVLFLNVIKRKERGTRCLIITLVALGGSFVVLYLVKSHIVDYMKAAMQTAGNDNEVGNIVTLSDLLSCLTWFNPINFFCDYSAKIFYATCGTGAVLIPGFLCMTKRIYVFLKKKDHSEQEHAVSCAMIFVLSSYVFTLAALVYRGYGSDFRYVIYGRYYEHMLPVLISFSLLFCIEYSKKISVKEMFMCLIFVLCIGVVTWIWCVSKLPDQSILIDTNRLAAFSHAITMNRDLGTVIGYLILIYTIYMFFYIMTYRKTYAKCVFFLMVLMTLWVNDKVCLNQIHAIHNRNIVDTEIAEYLVNHVDAQKIYMIDDNSYWYPNFYSKMQIYLKDHKMYVIKPEQNYSIEKGSYVIAYSTTGLKGTILSEYQFLMQGSTFVLYQK